MGHIRCSTIIPGTQSKVFEWITLPSVLPELLAESIQVEDHNEGRVLEKNAEFRFTMTRFGFAQPVRLMVTELTRGHCLIYRQTEGLFVKWVHTMKFEAHGATETLVTDLVDYQLPFGLFGFLADDLIVKRDLTNILSDRLRKAKEVFPNPVDFNSEDC